MKDAALTIFSYFPAAGLTINTGTLDLNVDVSSFSDQWRLGKLTVTVPALPNNVDAAKTVTVVMQDSGDGGATFATVVSSVGINLPGVAVTGSAAQVIDLPMPPGLRGPLQLQITVPAGVGDCTAAQIKAEWQNQD